MLDVERWRATWSGLGVEGPGDAAFEDLAARFAEPHRHYHAAQHIEECFARLDEARSLAERVFEVELVIYQTERFRESLEKRARANLQRSVRLLGG